MKLPFDVLSITYTCVSSVWAIDSVIYMYSDFFKETEWALYKKKRLTSKEEREPMGQKCKKCFEVSFAFPAKTWFELCAAVDSENNTLLKRQILSARDLKMKDQDLSADQDQVATGMKINVLANFRVLLFCFRANPPDYVIESIFSTMSDQSVTIVLLPLFV